MRTQDTVPIEQQLLVNMRILSLAPSNTEILFALGLGNSIIGVTRYCDYPEEAKRKPKVGSWITTEPKQIKKLKPDLIFTSYFVPKELCKWSGPGEVVHLHPKTLDGVLQSILHIGEATGRQNRAKSIIERMRKSLIIRQYGRRQRVYMEEWPTPPMTSGNWVPELVAIAGGIQILSKKGKPSCEFAFSDLEREKPDCMIFHWCGFGERFDRGKILQRNRWIKLKAVKENKLYTIDDSLINRPGPRLVEGVRKIQEALLYAKEA